MNSDADVLEAEKMAAVRSAEEARLAQLEAERSLKQSLARFEEMRKRWEESEAQIKSMTADRALKASTSADQADTERQSKRRIVELEAELDKVNQQCSELFNRIETELEVERLAKESALRQAREEQDKQLSAAQQEREELQSQLEQLREAGQALCGVYEERLAEVEADKRQAVASLQRAEDELTAAQTASARLSLSTVPQTPTALSIDNENLRLDLEHTKGRLHLLEEQLAEAQQSLETELDNIKRRKADWAEVEQGLRKEILTLQESVGQSASAVARWNFTDNWQQNNRREESSPRMPRWPNSKRLCENPSPPWTRNGTKLSV